MEILSRSDRPTGGGAFSATNGNTNSPFYQPAGTYGYPNYPNYPSYGTAALPSYASSLTTGSSSLAEGLSSNLRPPAQTADATNNNYAQAAASQLGLSSLSEQAASRNRCNLLQPGLPNFPLKPEPIDYSADTSSYYPPNLAQSSEQRRPTDLGGDQQQFSTQNEAGTAPSSQKTGSSANSSPAAQEVPLADRLSAADSALKERLTIDTASASSMRPRAPPKKRPIPVPNEQKDDAYWEKRKKNNDSAKRSRDQRRSKEVSKPRQKPTKPDKRSPIKITEKKH